MSESNVVHVTPLPDEPAHQADGLCWCQPIYEEVPPDGRIYIHRRTLDSPHIEMSEEARRNLEAGPGGGACGHFAGGTSHCMRDSGHSGDHEPVELDPSPVARQPLSPRDRIRSKIEAASYHRNYRQACIDILAIVDEVDEL